jgi:cytochrome c biogenesis protein CcdA
MKKFTTEQNLILSLIGVITLAASVNLVELACSAGFPTIFITILELNNVGMFAKVLYILIYILFFLVDDIVVFVVAMKTLEISGVTTKYNKYSHLVGGILMILIGLLLIFKPEWIMLNF